VGVVHCVERRKGGKPSGPRRFYRCLYSTLTRDAPFLCALTTIPMERCAQIGACMSLLLDSPRQTRPTRRAVIVDYPSRETLAAWTATLRSRRVSEQLADSACRRVRAFFYAGEFRSIDDVQPSAVRRVAAAMFSDGLQTEAVDRHLRAVEAFCGWLFDTEQITCNPLDGNRPVVESGVMA